jgi:hypothetical protein
MAEGQAPLTEDELKAARRELTAEREPAQTRRR